MRFCFLATADSVHSYRWIRYFAHKGHEIHWISLTPSSYPALPNTKFHDLSAGTNKWVALARAAARIRGLVRSCRPDIVHAHYAGSYGVLGALAGFRPFVLTAWGSDILFVGQERLRGAPVRWALRKAQIITCDAFHMVEAIRRLGTDERKIKVIFFGVEVDRFTPGSADGGIVERWQARGRAVVISLRSLEPVYSIATLIEAVPAVVSAVPDVLFVICGGGSQERELKSLVHDRGLGRHILFTGRYANAELPEMLRSAQVYVSTALSDAGISASTAEAMACGIPVVVTNTGENDKWIHDGQTGFLVPAKASTALADRIITLLRDPALRARLGEEGRSVITTRNNYECEMEKMEAICQDLLAATPVS
jgi:glycosyltransferase involved in cell wall biosynthesis